MSNFEKILEFIAVSVPFCLLGCFVGSESGLYWVVSTVFVFMMIESTLSIWAKKTFFGLLFHLVCAASFALVCYKAGNVPFEDFLYEPKSCCKASFVKQDPAWLWWVLAGLLIVRAFIIEPIIFHRKNK